MALPSGYKQLQYIRSSGTQYINAGVAADNNTRVVMDLERDATTAQCALFGSRVAFQNQAFCLWAYTGDNGYQDDYGTASKYPVKSGTTGGRHLLDKNKNVFSVDGTVVNTSAANTFSNGLPIYLLTINNNGTARSPATAAKLYSCQIYNNDTLVRDFVPCRSPSGVIGLYDCANGTFYSDAAGGAFAAGPETDPDSIENYRLLEYIQSSGTQYIDTGVSISPTDAKNIKVVVDESIPISVNSGVYALNGTGNSGTSYLNSFYLGIDTGGKIAYGDGRNDKSTAVSYGGQRTTFIYDAPNAQITVDGVASVSFDFVAPGTAVNFLLFGYNRGGGAVNYSTHVIYSCQIYRSGTLIRDYIPAMRKSDRAVGLYDLANGVFYTNAGTGSFVSGPAVGPTGSRTLLDATNYEIRTGAAMIDATAYQVVSSKTMVDGTIYTIELDAISEPVAMTVTGQARNGVAYAVCNGTTYAPSGLIQNVEIMSGDTIEVHASEYLGGVSAGGIYINGALVESSGNALALAAYSDIQIEFSSKYAFDTTYFKAEITVADYEIL